MVEIYWLQRLGNIGFCFNVGFWVCIIIACAVLITYLVGYILGEIDEFDNKRFMHWFKKFAIVFAFVTAGATFIPTQTDIMAIYGLGGTIDYIKNNDKAKKLPDKVVNALTRYIDHIEKEEGEENKDNNELIKK